MPFDDTLAARVTSLLQDKPGFATKKMFGGLTCMIRGHMCCGIVKDELMVRIGPDQNAEALSLPYARTMDFTGKAMKGFVYVGAEGLVEDDDLAAWVDRALRFNSSLAPK